MKGCQTLNLRLKPYCCNQKIKSWDMCPSHLNHNLPVFASQWRPVSQAGQWGLLTLRGQISGVRVKNTICPVCSRVHDGKLTHCRYIHVCQHCVASICQEPKPTKWLWTTRYRGVAILNTNKMFTDKPSGRTSKPELHATLVIFRTHTKCSRVLGTTVHAGVDFALLFCCSFGVVPSMSVFGIRSRNVGWLDGISQFKLTLFDLCRFSIKHPDNDS